MESNKNYEDLFNLADYQQKNNNNKRSIEINEYYSQKNQAYIDIFKISIIFILLLIINAILSKSNIIPGNISSIITSILIVILILIISIKIYNISLRDTRDFSQYKVPFDQKAELMESQGKILSITDELKKEMKGTFGCFDDMCCSAGMKFDKNKKMCILKSASDFENDQQNLILNTDEAGAISNIERTATALESKITDSELDNAIKTTKNNLLDMNDLSMKALN